MQRLKSFISHMKGMASKYRIVALMTICVTFSLAIVTYLVKAKSYTGSDIFWYGAVSGFLSCLFLVLLALTAYLALKLRYKT